MDDNKRKDELIGSLWLKDFGDIKFISGVVGGKRVIIRKNKNKKSASSPDYFVFSPKGDEDVTF